jgi:exosome complex protein LRP1
MSVQDVTPGLDKLEAQLDNLEACLGPLLENLSGNNASELPLLDQAKLYTLTNYVLESLLFCECSAAPNLNQRGMANEMSAGLRLQGADALNHPVFTTELKRVKQYFAKVEAAENPVQARTNTVDTEAATRMIRAGLVWPTP